MSELIDDVLEFVAHHKDNFAVLSGGRVVILSQNDAIAPRAEIEGNALRDV